MNVNNINMQTACGIFKEPRREISPRGLPERSELLDPGPVNERQNAGAQKLVLVR